MAKIYTITHCYATGAVTGGALTTNSITGMVGGLLVTVVNVTIPIATPLAT